ncbi:31432_t:CDS:2, partial [Gigaspora margarita]
FKKVVAITQLQTKILQNQNSKEISNIQENFYNTNATTPLPKENLDNDKNTEKDEEEDDIMSEQIALLKNEFLQETKDDENKKLESNSSRIGETYPANDNDSK